MSYRNPNPWRGAFFALVWVLVLVAVLVVGKRSWDWRAVTNDRGWKGEVANAYLAEPILKTPDGKVLTRAQVLDALIANAVQKSQEK